MKLLITGSGGMLGLSLKKFALSRDIEVLAPSRLEMDLLDETSTLRYMAAWKPDAIIHAAARVGGISANIEHPLRYLSENVRMDINLLTVAKDLEIEKLLYIGSSCMYPKNIEHPMSENEILTGPLEPTNEGYAMAKLVGWKMVRIIAENSNLDWRTVVLSNLYGPNDHFEPERSHLLAAIIRKITKAKSQGNESVDMWGDGSSRREFTYVDDVGEFLIESIAHLHEFPLTLNVGIGVDYSVREYYEFVAAALDYEGSIVCDLTKPTGMKRKLMDSTEGQKLGWKPKTDIQVGIRQTLHWYQSYTNEPSID